MVFGGDYLNQGTDRPPQIPGRFPPRLSYRMSMCPKDTPQAFRCRPIDFVRGVPDRRRAALPLPRPPASSGHAG